MRYLNEPANGHILVIFQFDILDQILDSTKSVILQDYSASDCIPQEFYPDYSQVQTIWLGDAIEFIQKLIFDET